MARAFKSWVGPTAELVAVASQRNDVEHVVVRVGDMYFDADGAQPKRALLDKMTNLERVPGPYLTAFDSSKARGVACPIQTVRKLKPFLTKRLGPNPWKRTSTFGSARSSKAVWWIGGVGLMAAVGGMVYLLTRKPFPS